MQQNLELFLKNFVGGLMEEQEATMRGRVWLSCFCFRREGADVCDCECDFELVVDPRDWFIVGSDEQK